MTPKSAVLRASARRDGEQVLAHYLDEGGADVAVGFIDALEEALRHIARNPASGSPRYGHDLTLAGLRSWPTAAYPYNIFYMEAQGTVDVWRILHRRRDIPESMREGL